MRVLLTGATGFAGSFILKALLDRGMHVCAPVRRALPPHPHLVEVTISDLQTADWRSLCHDADVVIHAAAYAHDDNADPQMIMRINCDATIKLAQAAGEAGSRFIFLSSIRAQAGASSPVPLRDGDVSRPVGPYGEAKRAAEQVVAELCINHVNLRLAPLYGPGVKGNLARLFDLAKTGVPLPFGGLNGRRSLLAVEALAELVMALLDEGADLRGTYLAAEPAPLSIGEMIAILRHAVGLSPRLIDVPPGLIRAACFALRKPLLWERLGGSLVIDDDLLLRRRFPALFHPSAMGLAMWMKADQAR